MSFFEPPPLPPEPPEPEELERPEWSGPSRNVLGAAVPLRLVLVKTGDLAIAVTEASAYPNGFDFNLVARSRRHEFDQFDDPFLWRHRRARPGRELPPEFFRFGIEFSDGSKATNVGGFPDPRPEARPAAPVLVERGGRGGGGEWEQRYWVWPLPPSGPLAFVCEWPALGVPLTRNEIDAALIRDAAERAEVLWEDAAGPVEDDGWTGLAEIH